MPHTQILHYGHSGTKYVEYLGKFNALFETASGFKSGDQEVLNHEEEKPGV